MQKEHHIYRQIQSLDSEMQTLVYENYNKFISATDTIRKVNILNFVFQFIVNNACCYYIRYSYLIFIAFHFYLELFFFIKGI